MDYELILPSDFEDYAWEVEAKGVFWDAAVQVGGARFQVTFYAPERLTQDIVEELRERSSFELSRTIVLETVTEDQMRDAIRRLTSDFFT